MELNINWQNLLSKKRKYIIELIKSPGERYHHDEWDYQKTAVETERLKKQLKFLDEKSQKRIEEMVVKTKEIGYMVHNHPRGEKYTNQGNLCIRGKRGNFTLYGFINPLGRLSLDRRVNTKWINSLTINYRKINMIVRDNFLVALLKTEEK